MKSTIKENGITIKKLLKTIVIPYADIKSIREDYRSNVITTKSGDSYDINLELSTLSGEHPELFKYIEKYNIDFENLSETKHAGQLYTYEEALQIANKTEEMIRRFANEVVSEKLGPEYEVETKYYDLADNTSRVDLILLKNRSKVKLTKEFMNEFTLTGPDAFDAIDLFRGPVLWDTENRCAKYSITEECMDESECKQTTREYVSDFCEKYADYMKE